MRYILETFLSLNLEQKKEANILHITDTHLFAESGATLLGVDTNASFRAVLDEIKQRNTDFDLIVATGDFVQDSSQKAYEYFAQDIATLNKPCVYIPGNHDVLPLMNDVFNAQGLCSEKVILMGEHWLIILLNTHVAGAAYGRLSSDELAFLSSTLSLYPQRQALIFLHHHPIFSGCKWLDHHCLKNSNELEDIIKSHQNVKAIGCGHIHQLIEQQWLNTLTFSTPSTCVQFKPSSDNFCLSNQAPGWRMIKLKANGDLSTNVDRLACHLFLPDMSQNGY